MAVVKYVLTQISIGMFYVFSQERKITLEHFLNGRNQTKIKNMKNAKILVKSVKNSLFGRSKRQNSVVFQGSGLKFCMHVDALIHIFRFLKIQKNYENFGKKYRNIIGKF